MLDDFRIREFTEMEARMLNPLQLALIGDGVYEIFIRNYILANNTALSANKIHVKAIQYVKAKSQASIMHKIEGFLDYRMATGFEALVGYLYLSGKKDRLEFIFNKSIEMME